MTIDDRLIEIENSMKKMGDAFGEGMTRMSRAMEQMAEGLSKIQSNAEEHRVLHQRIDTVHDDVEQTKLDLAGLQRDYHHCCGNSRPELTPMHPVKVALVTTGAVLVLASYVALVLLHSKDLWALLSNVR